MLWRNVTPGLLEARADSPVVFLSGARQTGKSTLARWLVSKKGVVRYLTLDDAGVLSSARADPAGFVAGLDGPVVLDEVQRAPELFLAIKASVDRNRRPGRFLLTGSTDILLLPRLSESLAGRMEILTLWPLSQGEIEGVTEGFVDLLFGRTPLPVTGSSRERHQLIGKMLAGGYPEILGRHAPDRRRAWFGSYITAILQRDVRDLSNIEGLTALPRLLTLLATRATSLLNFAELSRQAALPQSTLKRYLTLLETTFLVQVLPPWSGNLGKRLIKSPKLIINDSGLMSYLLGLNDGVALGGTPLLGSLIENFVIAELRKQVAWSQTRPQLFHFRTLAGQEIDIVLEDTSGRLVGIEVKASATISAHDFKGLKLLAEEAGKRFHRGVVLYTGTQSIPFGARLHALPVSSLWRMGAKTNSQP